MARARTGSVSLRRCTAATLLLLCLTALVQAAEPTAIRDLRARQDLDAGALRELALQLKSTGSAEERAWADLAVADFENDMDQSQSALRRLVELREAARAAGDVEREFAALSLASTIESNRGGGQNAEPLLQRMQQLTAAGGRADWQAEVLHGAGVVERKHGRFDRSLEKFEQALSLCRQQRLQACVARELNSIGLLHGRTGRFADALFAHSEALRIARELSDGPETTRSLRLLGMLYRNLDDEELAADNLREGLRHVAPRNHREAISINGELAAALLKLGRLEEAERHVQQSVAIAELAGSPPNRVNAFTRMAEFQLARGNLAEAADWAERAFAVYDKVAIRDQILLRITRARVWAAQDRTEIARTEAEWTLQSARQIGDRMLERAALDLLADQQLASGHAASAYATRKAHQALDKELAMDVAARRIALLESRLDREREEAERQMLARDHQIQTLTLARQRLIGTALAAGLAAVLLLAATLYWRYREARRSNHRLSASRNELEQLHQALLEKSVELQRVANTDALTGLYNRRAIGAELDNCFQRAQVDATALGILLFDLDLFKRINDELGHPAGDAVLHEAAQRLCRALPDIAAIGRWGGEEFLAVLPNCNLDTSLNAAECARLALATEPVHFEAQSIPISASIGVAALPGPYRNVGPLVSAADQALYRAKRSGRNRVEPAQPIPT